MTTPSLNHPDEEICSWVEQGQLRLVAVALTELTTESPRRSHEHSVAALRGKLAPLLEQAETKWDTWWKKVQPWLKESEHFQFNKTGNTVTYRLADRIAAGNIPVERVVGKPKTTGTGDSTGSSSSSPARKSAAKSGAGRDLPEWVRWLWAADDAPLPGTTPPDGLAVLLETCPEEIIERVMARLMSGVEEALAAPRLTPKAKDQWLELVTKAHRRRQEVPLQESTGATARRTPKVLAQLLDAIEQQARIQPLLAQIGTLINSDQHRRQEFARGVWDTFQSDRATAETLLKRLASTLDDKQQVALWGDVLTAAFAAPSYPNRTTDVNRVTGWLKAGQQATAIHRLILQAALLGTAESDVAAFVAESRYAGKSSGPEKLNALVTAGLLLSEGEGQVVSVASQAYGDAFDQTNAGAYNTLIASLLDVSISKLKSEERRWSGKLVQLQNSHKEELAGKESEIRRLDEQAQTYSADLVAKRQESRFEIREGMLLHTGSVLQGMYQLEPAARIGYVMEHLPRILHAGDAEVFGSVGSEVAYNSALHHSPEEIPSGSLVKVSVPGVILKGSEHPIIKANVVPKSEVS